MAAGVLSVPARLSEFFRALFWHVGSASAVGLVTTDNSSFRLAPNLVLSRRGTPAGGGPFQGRASRCESFLPLLPGIGTDRRAVKANGPVAAG